MRYTCHAAPSHMFVGANRHALVGRLVRSGRPAAFFELFGFYAIKAVCSYGMGAIIGEDGQ